jgi:hypothetical protein
MRLLCRVAPLGLLIALVSTLVLVLPLARAQACSIPSTPLERNAHSAPALEPATTGPSSPAADVQGPPTTAMPSATALLSAWALHTLTGLVSMLEGLASWLRLTARVVAELYDVITAQVFEAIAHPFNGAALYERARRTLPGATPLPRAQVALVASRVRDDAIIIARVAGNIAVLVTEYARNMAMGGTLWVSRAANVATCSALETSRVTSDRVRKAGTVVVVVALRVWRAGNASLRDSVRVVGRLMTVWAVAIAGVIEQALTVLRAVTVWFAYVLYGGIQVGLNVERMTWGYIAYWGIVAIRVLVVAAFAYLVPHLLDILRLVHLQNPVRSLSDAESIAFDTFTPAQGQPDTFLTSSFAPACALAPARVRSTARTPIGDTSPSDFASEREETAVSSSVASLSPSISPDAQSNPDDEPEDDLESGDSDDNTCVPICRRPLEIIQNQKAVDPSVAARLPLGLRVKYEDSGPMCDIGFRATNCSPEEPALRPQQRRESALPKFRPRRNIRKSAQAPSNPEVISIDDDNE